MLSIYNKKDEVFDNFSSLLFIKFVKNERD